MDHQGSDIDIDVQEYDQQEQTQSTQQTQEASQGEPRPDDDSHLWGFLQPCSPKLTRIDFWKIRPVCTLGRNTAQNMVVLPGLKISNTHCVISWDGSEDNGNVTVQDLSSNGTFINNQKIGRNNTRVLKEGNEIAFGTCTPNPANGGLEDYRFIFRLLAKKAPEAGLYCDYDVIHELGKGSFAVVMKAIQRSTGKYYAVKMIQESRQVRGNNNDTDAANGRRKLFTREIGIMEKLKHPNITELKEVFFEESGDINLVLELVEGGDLLDYILKKEGLSEVDAQHITYQICDALAYIHSESITHRDLKPENILLTKDNPPRVKVADFGLAKIVDSLTWLRTMCGTPSYLAPEVVRQQDTGGYGNVVDSWSVGVIVFSMLCNASPFNDADDPRDIRTRIAERQIMWELLNEADVSEDAQDFIRQLLHEDPRQRMTMAEALLHPWMKSYTPVYPIDSFSNLVSEFPSPPAEATTLANGNGIPQNDVSMNSSMSDELQNLRLNHSMAVADDTSSLPTPQPAGRVPKGVADDAMAVEGDAISSQPSSSQGLRRRSHVISDAASDGHQLPEPSPEMIATAASERQRDEATANDEAGPSDSKGKGGKKRMHAELSLVPEEDAAMGSGTNSDASSPLSDIDDSIYNLSKPMSTGTKPLPTKSTRGKGKPASTTKRTTRATAAASGSNEEEKQEPRRTGRPSKQARRN